MKKYIFLQTAFEKGRVRMRILHTQFRKIGDEFVKYNSDLLVQTDMKIRNEWPIGTVFAVPELKFSPLFYEAIGTVVPVHSNHTFVEGLDPVIKEAYKDFCKPSLLMSMRMDGEEVTNDNRTFNVQLEEVESDKDYKLPPAEEFIMCPVCKENAGYLRSVNGVKHTYKCCNKHIIHIELVA